ncbi:tripartite tricarboxylate transporter TctB family protein [Telmatospirillum sp. J64-1]|uniref:tripartite tricarboxylate transporter TctB family protein n=1 Tax=Telmatospirillum sp. J64-1 TaxID=2502183 RepID=UPI00115E1D3D|nr:tripartite tricarboxylate transporter TctB family protein [Telmatospirillum sp. J64-1]
MMQSRDVTAGIVFLGLGVGAAMMGKDYVGGAGALPTAIGSIMALLGAILALRGLRSRPAGDAPAKPLFTSLPLFAVTAAICVVYVMALPSLGFFTSSALFVPVLALALGFRRPLYLAGATVIFLVLLYAVFILLLRRPLPAEFFMAF